MPLASRYRRALAQPLSTLRALRRRFLPSPRVAKSHEVYIALGSWTFGAAPRRPINDIFTGIEAVSIDLENVFNRTPGTSVEPAELVSLCAMVRFLGCHNIVEIGTFDGNTALNLAANSPADATVWTLDLPPGKVAELAIPIPAGMRNLTVATRPSSQFEASALAGKIHQVFGDSATFDWTTFSPPVDFVFIDGCHHYEYVRHDTRRALEYLAPRGVLVWHDYGMVADVSRAVDEFSDSLEISAIRGQRLAIGRRPRCAETDDR